MEVTIRSSIVWPLAVAVLPSRVDAVKLGPTNRILILGGGFAGLYTAMELEKAVASVLARLPRANQ